MPRKDVAFETSDHVVLRGWLFTPAKVCARRLPCLIMAHGWSGVKEMDLDIFAEHFVSVLDLVVLVYDNRGFGASDTGIGQPRHEIIASVQRDDYRDAITYAQTLDNVDLNKIGIWGSGYSGGHVLCVGAADKRVKAVLSQAPLVNGSATIARQIRPDYITAFRTLFQEDRINRFQGKKAAVVPVVTSDGSPSTHPTAESYQFFKTWESKSSWQNEVTVRSLELSFDNDATSQIQRITPTPLLLTVAQADILAPTDLALEAYSRAREPKQLHILPGGHFDIYSGSCFAQNVQVQADFLKKWLCS